MIELIANYFLLFFIKSDFIRVCVLGPGCNLFLRQLNFVIGPFPVDKFTSPGVCVITIVTTVHRCHVLAGMV